MAERLSEKPLIDVATRKEYMYFIDSEGYLARSKYATNKLSDAEKDRRAKEKAKRAEARKKQREESEARKEAKKKEQIKRAKERLEKLTK